MWKPCFFPQMPPGTTKKEIQRSPRNSTLDQTNKKIANISISSNWNQICRHLIMLVAATTPSSLMWKPCFFPQMPPATTKNKIQRPQRNFNPRSNKQKKHINFFQLKSNLQTSSNVGSSNHPVIINVKALLLSADAPRNNKKENSKTATEL